MRMTGNYQLKAERQRRLESLKKLQEAIALYNESWEIYFDSSPHLNKSLQQAATKLTKALSLDPENPDILKYGKLVGWKLNGEERLLKGRTCERQAANAFRQKNYQFSFSRYADAITDYRSAMDSFEEGMMKGQDSRFKPSYTKSLEELQNSIAKRETVRPLKEEEERKRELERPLRNKMLEEEKLRVLKAMEMEEKKRRMKTTFFVTGATAGSLALMTTGGPGSSNTENGYFGVTGHEHGGNSSLSGASVMNAIDAASSVGDLTGWMI